ncbi:MAG: hypothetical protein KME16_24350 [Scytolyngbya sp. HA4215-MV1]|jgi:hypothetical protein|nr:hypothetical protein [Scytolyngbya sp. HA4215-MV1]
MNEDSDAMQQSFIRLLQDLALTDVPPGTGQPAPAQNIDGVYRDDPAVAAWDTLDSEEFGVFASQMGLHNLPFQREPLLQPGELPAVQDRFHALLKRRLQTEIQRHPPLFPWETEITDYETESLGVLQMADMTEPSPVPVGASANRQRPVWLTQLQNLNLPVSLPETVLVQLLERCQEAVQSSLREGAKLVRVVESLFPDQSQSLNQLAGLVMVSPARSGGALASTAFQGSDFPTSYEAAVPAQQMVLSLLAAREIIGSLTLSLSASAPTLERQWLTAAGVLTLQAGYTFGQTPGRLQIQGTLPCGGRLSLKAGEAHASTQRTSPGGLSLELLDLPTSQTYSLEVELQIPDQNPLVFAIGLVDEPSLA